MQSEILLLSLVEMREDCDLKEIGRKKPEQEGNREANIEMDKMEGNIFMLTSEQLTYQ